MDNVKTFLGDIFSNVWTWVVIVVIALVLLRGANETTPTSKIDPFSGVLVVDAPGCEITGPDGKSLKDELRGNDQVMIPKGTTLNGDCFPATKAARESVQ